ncbi:hypothetical protein CANTEDRAFT_133651 [Yamadazyma tenuis ATCC 10573]|uniref:Uncharacterized protein n=1 Tax=Candida tenuis (strain ATCC 10573 / BCRC 21748 / CBS 615 / JCM 9827 / NBRC 10315 / NRRL Y-1498 / VKM Y-70) TaxID=590646 RepID=G3B098_CANTC|nr:uncharacterized protein CANTEDRAFT_133651 [Yamadazyma tenuis ATCC 10573]EGV65352.1 hypothetical protein CANTEDRAFT_133651 [Yamadazyma tenuis ATCC 10573]
MWKYKEPSSTQQVHINEYLKAKLEDFPQINNKVPKNLEFDKPHQYDFDLSTKSKGTANTFTEVVQDTISLELSLPSHKVFVEEQWKYLISLMVCNRSRPLMLMNSDIFAFLQASRVPRMTLDRKRKLHEATMTNIAREMVFDLVTNISRLFFGSSLEKSDGIDFKTLLNYKMTTLHCLPDLPVLGLPRFGSIIVGEVKKPSIKHWIKQLHDCNYMIFINVSERNDSITKSLEGSLNQLIAYQIMAKCKLGYISDTIVHIFTTITDINDKVMSVKVDITISSRIYNENPEMYPPAALMLAKIAEIQRMKPKTYLDFYFDETMTTRNFQWFKKSLNHLKHTYIYYDLKTTDEIQREPGLYSQIFCIPNKYLASTFLSLDIPGEEIVVKVFDPGYYFISNWSYKYQYDDARYNIQQYFENDIEHYQKPYFAVNYENMFMDKGKFIFSHYNPPTEESEESDDTPEVESFQSQRIKEFIEVWRKKDPEYSYIIAKESVNRFEEETQREITLDNDVQNPNSMRNKRSS